MLQTARLHGNALEDHGFPDHKRKDCKYLPASEALTLLLAPVGCSRTFVRGRIRREAWRMANARMQDPARSRWTGRRAGLGSKMSTQRRASRTIAAIETDRADVRRRWFSISGSSRPQRHGRVAVGCGLTAPLMSILWLAWAWLLSFDGSSMEAADREATNSLLSDCHNETLAWLDSRSGSPPPGGVGVRGPSQQRGTHRLSLRHDSLLPVRTYLHPTLPIAPAGEDRWAERHDGKRDLYFQHAA